MQREQCMELGVKLKKVKKAMNVQTNLQQKLTYWTETYINVIRETNILQFIFETNVY